MFRFFQKLQPKKNPGLLMAYAHVNVDIISYYFEYFYPPALNLSQQRVWGTGYDYIQTYERSMGLIQSNSIPVIENIETTLKRVL